MSCSRFSKCLESAMANCNSASTHFCSASRRNSRSACHDMPRTCLKIARFEVEDHDLDSKDAQNRCETGVKMLVLARFCMVLPRFVAVSRCRLRLRSLSALGRRLERVGGVGALSSRRDDRPRARNRPGPEEIRPKSALSVTFSSFFIHFEGVWRQNALTHKVIPRFQADSELRAMWATGFNLKVIESEPIHGRLTSKNALKLPKISEK